MLAPKFSKARPSADKDMTPKAVNSVDTYVAGRLRSYRNQVGMSQAEVARQIGVTFQQIQKYEAGINRIGAGRLFQLAGLYGVPIQDLFPHATSSAASAKHTEKIDAIASFASSADGTRLCEAFLHIKDLRQRKIVLSLIEEMSDR